jgi:hypothetical protein
LEKAVVGIQKSLVLWRTNNNGGYLHFSCWYASDISKLHTNNGPK